MPTVRGRDAQRDGETQARPLPHFLCREEWLEHPPAQLSADAGPVVDDLRRLAALVGIGPDGDGAWGFADGVLGIQHEVQHHLLDFLAVDQHRHQTRVQLERQGDVAQVELVLAQVRRGANDLVQIRRRSIGRGPAHEREQIADDLPGARGFLSDQLEIALLDGGGALLDHQLDAPDDRLKGIVNLVRHAGHQLADGRQALAVDELIAELQLVGDVALDADEMRHAPAPVPERDNGARRRERAAVLPPVYQRTSPDPRLADLGPDVIHRALEATLEQGPQAHRAELVAGVA